MMANYGWSMLALFLFSILVFLVPVSMAAAELGTGWPEDGGIYAWVREAFGGQHRLPRGVVRLRGEHPVVPDRAVVHGGVARVRVQPRAREQQALPRHRDARVLLGHDGTEPAGREVVGDGERDRHRARFDLPRDPRRGARRRVARRRQPLADPVLDRRADARRLVREPRVPRRDHPALHRDGDGRASTPRRPATRPGRCPARSSCRSRSSSRSRCSARCSSRSSSRRRSSASSPGRWSSSRQALDQLGVGWLLRPLALIVALGGIAHLSPWILGPAKGVAAVARDGGAPAARSRPTHRDVPVELLVVQGIGGTIFSLLFLLVPSVSTSYWMLSAVTAQIIAVMYALMFAAVIRLRYTAGRPARPVPDPRRDRRHLVVAGAGFARVRGHADPRVRAARSAQDGEPGGVRVAVGRRRRWRCAFRRSCGGRGNAGAGERSRPATITSTLTPISPHSGPSALTPSWRRRCRAARRRRGRAR